MLAQSRKPVYDERMAAEVRETTVTLLPISAIRTNGGTQLRAEIDQSVVLEYAEMIDNLPPVVVYADGSHFWLADGFHRLKANLLKGRQEILSEVRQGTRRDAVLFAAGPANSRHGLRRTPADKRKCVLAFLSDETWSKWNDSAIARAACVAPQTVTKYRPQFEGAPNPETTRLSRSRSGKVIQTRAFVPHARNHQPSATVPLENGDNGHAKQACCPNCGHLFPVC
jgi:hypothetical protein